MSLARTATCALTDLDYGACSPLYKRADVRAPTGFCVQPGFRGLPGVDGLR